MSGGWPLLRDKINDSNQVIKSHMSISSNKYRTGGQNEGGKAGKRKEEDRERERGGKKTQCIVLHA